MKEKIIPLSFFITQKMRALAELETAYNEYRIYPERHPVYKQVWKDYWFQRKQQLEKGKKN